MIKKILRRWDERKIIYKTIETHKGESSNVGRELATLIKGKRKPKVIGDVERKVIQFVECVTK